MTTNSGRTAYDRTSLRPIVEREAVLETSPDVPAPRGIRVSRKGETAFELPIYPDVEYTFGRDRSCTVVIADLTVSRDHGMLTCRADGSWVYRDKGSSNGSFLADRLESDEEVEQVTKLNPGRSYRIAAGQSVVLGNQAGRISFLADPPRPNAEETEERSPATIRLEKDTQRNARHRMPVFLLGPTGSGKTHAARRIHELSGVGGHFVLVDCGSLAKDLNSLRSELLGHVKGAYTEAREPRLGKLYHADGGTLFLDEVESLSPEGQGLLLNLIDGTGDFTPLGQAANIDQKRPQFRLISASKLPLRQSGLREDLCNRLGRGGIILLPTLEERRADIPVMVSQMVATLNMELQLAARFDPAATRLLQEASWPGHVRELEGVVRTVVELEWADRATEPFAAQTGEFKRIEGRLVPKEQKPNLKPLLISAKAVRHHLEARQLAFGAPLGDAVDGCSPVPLLAPRSAIAAGPGAPAARKRPQDYSRDELEAALKRSAYNLTHAAQSLGVAPNTLKKLIQKHGIERGSR